MFNNNQVSQLIHAVDLFKIPIPESILKATALHDAAVVFHQKVHSERAPDIDRINIKNLESLHEQIVAWPSHSERERFSLMIEQNTEAKRMWAWEAEVPLWLEAFRQPFDDAAALFIKSFTELDGMVSADAAIRNYQHESHRLMMSSASDLQTLGKLRNILALSESFDAGHAGIAALGRVMKLPAFGAFEGVKNKLSREPQFELKWWAVAATIKGVEIKWRTASEQQTLAMLR